MIVGYMRRSKKPGHMAKLLAIMSKHEGIDLIYLTPEDISTRTGKVEGKMLINQQWLNVKMGLPKFIDINPNFFNSEKFRDVINYLKNNTLLSADKRMPFPKDELHRFKEDPYLSKFLIPTENVKNMNDIEHFVDKYNTIVLKPVRSNRGRNVFILKKENEIFILGLNKEQRELTNESFEKFYNEQIKDTDYIVQKYISSRNMQGDPFDCRIHVEKNGEGKWSNPRNFIRIGIGQKVISNISQGGGIGNLKQFLQTNYEESWESIHKEIKNLAKVLPYKIEDLLEKDYMTFGFDIGIDETGHLFIFEINDFPIVSPMKSEIAMMRAGYYRYILSGSSNQK